MLLKLQYTTEDEASFDYTYSKYIPLCDHENKLKSLNMLFNSFDAVGCGEDYYSLVKRIQEAIGVNRTVWGVKNLVGEIFWEFYFYNYEKKDPLVNITNIIKVLKPFFKIDLKTDEGMLYFMFSFDLPRDFRRGKELRGFHLYFQDPVNTCTGPSYFLDESGLKLENYYSFFDAKKEIRQIISEIKNSTFYTQGVKLNDILLPELINCRRICIARKQTNDGIYYAGLNIEQFLFFLKNLDYPLNIINFIKKYKNKFDYLQFDVGFDYKTEQKKLKILKNGYYGTF